MRKNLIIVLLLLLSNWCFGQYNQESLKKSVVKIMVKSEGEASFYTGFVWKNTKQIITTLHALKPNAQITVIYNEQFPKQAHVMKVHKESDLVLLKVDAEPPRDVEVFNEFSSTQLQTDETIFLYGFTSMQSSLAVKNSKIITADSLTFNALVNQYTQINLDNGNAINASFPVIKHDYVWLPGMSGTPVINASGELVGILDGGFEIGTLNLSWIIPAKFIDELEKSTNTSSPENTNNYKNYYSAEAELLFDEEATYENDLIESSEKLFKETYNTLEVNNFLFQKTKTRSLNQLLSSTSNLNSINEISALFPTFKFNFDNILFDIYQDQNKHICFVLPHGKLLKKSDESDYFDFTVDFEYKQTHALNYSFGWIEDLMSELTDEDLANNAIELAKSQEQQIDTTNNLLMLEYIERYQFLENISFHKKEENDQIVRFDNLYSFEQDKENLLTRQMYFLKNSDNKTYRIYYYMALSSNGNILNVSGMSGLEGDFFLKYNNLDCGKKLDDNGNQTCKEASELFSLLLSIYFTNFAINQ